MNDDDRKVAARLRYSFLSKLSEALQPTDIAAVHHVLGHFIAAARRQRGDQPG